MRTPVDLHPDDTALRAYLNDELRAGRIADGLSQCDLADRMGVTQSAVARMEHRLTWRMRTLYARSRALGCTLTVVIDGRPIHGLTDVARCRLAVLRISIARQVAGLSERDVADRLGVSESAVRGWEDNPDNPVFAELQRHARAAEVSLTATLEVPDAAV